MFEKLNDFISIIYIGVFISFAALIGIVINKYSLVFRQGFELDIAISCLSIFALVIPIVLHYTKSLNLFRIITGFILLLLLYVDLFIWIVIFHGFKALPSPVKSLNFLLPTALFFIVTIVFVLSQSQKNWEEHP